MRVKISKVDKFWTPQEKNLIIIKIMIFVNISRMKSIMSKAFIYCNLKKNKMHDQLLN